MKRKITKLLLLLLFTVYGSAALATPSYHSAYSSWGWSSNSAWDWHDKSSDNVFKPYSYNNYQFEVKSYTPYSYKNKFEIKSFSSYSTYHHYDFKSCGSDHDDKEYDVPEPGIVGLLAIGLLGMVVARRRMKQ